MSPNPDDDAARSVDLDVDLDAHLVRRLVASQFPCWADLPISPVEFGGWDNRTFRLGADKSVRLPSEAAYSVQVEKEHRWLPVLGPGLPLPVPGPLAKGAPGQGYPWNWSVYRWLEGEIASTATIGDLTEFAAALAVFLAALQQVDPTGGPMPGRHNFFRGGPLETYDSETRTAIAALGDQIDSGTATAAWEAANAAKWHGSPVWFHGDVSASNLLVRDGRLSAVIDFGTSGVGDPACDVTIAWTFLSGASREAFRASFPGDAATWSRGRGWALWKGLITIVEHRDSNPDEAAKAARVVDEVLADYRQST
ncbi:aminoglycoside phosphotransferase family protein [Micrococcaceae bacterium Sec5.7]